MRNSSWLQAVWHRLYIAACADGLGSCLAAAVYFAVLEGTGGWGGYRSSSQGLVRIIVESQHDSGWKWPWEVSDPALPLSRAHWC